MNLTPIQSVAIYFLGYICLMAGGSIYQHTHIGLGTMVASLSIFVMMLPLLSRCYYGRFE